MRPPLSVTGGLPEPRASGRRREIADAPAWTRHRRRRAWSTPDRPSVLRAMDRFHPIPARPGVRVVVGGVAVLQRPQRRRPAALLPDVPGRSRARPGTRTAGVRLQLDRDGTTTTIPPRATVGRRRRCWRRRPNLDIAGNRVRLDGSRYRIDAGAAGRDRARCVLDRGAGTVAAAGDDHAARAAG